jgi:hypothetical protein
VPLVLDNVLVLVALAAVLFAPLTAWFAARRSRRPVIWFVFGALIGPLAIALLALAPPGRCPWCGALVEGWPSACRQCGRALGASEDTVTSIPMPQADDLNGNAVEASTRARRSRSPRAATPVAMLPETRPKWRDVPASPAASPEAHVGDIVSTGVYVSGNAGLEIGATYALSRVPGPDGDRIRVFGPVDQGQITIRHEGPIDAFEITGIDDRVIINARDERSSLTCVFRAIGGLRGTDLERAFSESRVNRRPTRPRSARGP